MLLENEAKDRDLNVNATMLLLDIKVFSTRKLFQP
jgi:hypothetical protein